MPFLKSRSKLVDQLFLALAVCVILTGVFWSLFQTNQYIKDLFAVSGGFVTIVGFYIALEQLAQLRGEKEIISDTRVKDRLEDIKELLTDLQRQLSGTISVDIIKSCVHDLRTVQKKVMYIKLEECKFMDCDALNRDVKALVIDLNSEIANLKVFNSTLYEERIAFLLHTVMRTERQIMQSI